MAEGQKGPEAFRTISEVAEDLDLPQHVLRFWETRFHQIKPLKRAGGRRYYRPEDVEVLKGIRVLLYDEGFTIKGVQRLLKDRGTGFAVAAARHGSAGMMAAEQSAARPPETEGHERQSPDTQEPVPAASVRAGQASLSPEARRRLEAVAADLLEAKRQLDGVR